MQGLYLLPDQWYDDFNITCWLNTHVTAIEPRERQVMLGTGETLAYDRLILTTGSESYVPPIEGFGVHGCFVLRTAEDAMAIRAYVQECGCRTAVVAGGGLLGLEAAYGLHKLGLSVTVLERTDTLLSRQLDMRSAQFLYQYLDQMGIHVIMQAETERILGGSDVFERAHQVVLRDGQVLPCDLFLVAAGIRAELELARSIGLATNQGVIVDAEMRTNDRHVFAAGDVAELEGKLYGLWPVAVGQAEVAAANAVMAPDTAAATYAETPPVTMLKVAGIDLTSIGRIHALSEQELVIALEEPNEHRYRKLVIADGKIVGAILLGYVEDAPGVTAAIKDRVDVTANLDALKSGNWACLSI
jgi:NAD(P)H-nitrite reductase large subunit